MNLSPNKSSAGVTRGPLPPTPNNDVAPTPPPHSTHYHQSHPQNPDTVKGYELHELDSKKKKGEGGGGGGGGGMMAGGGMAGGSRGGMEGAGKDKGNGIGGGGGRANDRAELPPPPPVPVSLLYDNGVTPPITGWSYLPSPSPSHPLPLVCIDVVLMSQCLVLMSHCLVLMSQCLVLMSHCLVLSCNIQVYSSYAMCIQHKH